MIASAHTTTNIIESIPEWDNLRAEWDQLHTLSPAASVPLRFDWLRNWWTVYGESDPGSTLQILTLRENGQLLAVAPLYLQTVNSGPFAIGSLRFLSTGEPEADETCPDYLNLLFLPGMESRCVRWFWDTIQQLPWEWLELLDLPSDSPLVETDGFAAVLQRGSCPIANLEGGFDQYLSRLSSKRRQWCRRLIRNAEKAGAEFQLADTATMDEFYQQMISLHQARWQQEGKPGVFASPRFTEFHRRQLAAWLPSGQAVLARLTLHDQPVAVLYGSQVGEKFDFYQCGVSRDTELQSAGNLAHLLLMRALSTRGIQQYDFLRGASEYKQRLATDENQLVELEQWRKSLPNLLYHSACFTSRLWRRGIRTLRRERS